MGPKVRSIPAMQQEKQLEVPTDDIYVLGAPLLLIITTDKTDRLKRERWEHDIDISLSLIQVRKRRKRLRDPAHIYKGVKGLQNDLRPQIKNNIYFVGIIILGFYCRQLAICKPPWPLPFLSSVHSSRWIFLC